MLLIKKIQKKHKEFIKHCKNIRFYNDKDSVIYIDLKNRTKVRTYLNLIIRLKEVTNAPIVFAFNPLLIFTMVRWFSKFDNLFIQNPFKKKNILWNFSHKNNATFKITYDFKLILNSEEFINNAIPYILHPEHYFVDKLNINNEKKAGILFSGNFNKEIYGTTYIKDKFGIENRYDILQQVKKSTYYFEANGKEFIQNIDTNIYIDKLVHMKHQNGAIQIRDWLKYLSKSKFLFCAPGMTMPMCHNVLEALSVGVVPIINYQNWLNPSLIDNHNCLTYSDLNSIQKVIEKAINMNETEYNKLKDNAVLYYNSHYKNFNFDEKKAKTLTMLNEHKKDL